MAPAPRHALQAAALLTLISLTAPPVGAQRPGADSLLVVGNIIRFRTKEADARLTEAVILARRGDTLDVRIRGPEGGTTTANERSLLWRALPRLEARDVSVAEGASDGALIGALIGATVGGLSARRPSGALDFSLPSIPGLLAAAGGALGGLLGFMMDASSDGRPWVPIAPS